MEEMTIPISENIIEVEIICTDFHCPCLLAGEKKLHTETMTKRLMMRLKPSGKKEHILGCLKGENTRLQEK